MANSNISDKENGQKTLQFVSINRNENNQRAERSKQNSEKNEKGGMKPQADVWQYFVGDKEKQTATCKMCSS